MRREPSGSDTAIVFEAYLALAYRYLGGTTVSPPQRGADPALWRWKRSLGAFVCRDFRGRGGAKCSTPWVQAQGETRDRKCFVLGAFSLLRVGVIRLSAVGVCFERVGHVFTGQR